MIEPVVYDWKTCGATITISAANLTKEDRYLYFQMRAKKFGICKRGKQWFIKNYGRELKNGKGMDRFEALRQLMNRQIYEAM